MTDDTAAITELLHKYYDTLAWANGDRHRLWSDERRLQVRQLTPGTSITV